MRISAVVLTALAIGYPLVSHAAVLLDAPILALLWLTLTLAAGYFADGRSPLLGLLAALCLLGAVLGTVQQSAAAMQRVPPIIIAFGLAWVFGRTLLPGRQALIVGISERMRGELPERLRRYAYYLTAVWTAFLFLMGLECLLLALFASPFWWSLFTNLINYLLIAALLVLEYPVRRLVLRDLEHPPFLTSLRGSLRLNLH